MDTRIQAIARLAVSIYAFMILSESFRRRREIEQFLQISIVNAGMGLWNFLLFLYYTLETPDAVYLASQWGFVSVNLTNLGLFVFSSRLVYERRADRWIPFFAAVPAITCALSVTAPFQRLFLAGYHGFLYMPLRELDIIPGPWFAVHSAWGYLLGVLSVALLLVRSTRPHVKNRGVTILLATAILALFVVLSLSNFTRLKSVVQKYAFLAHLFCISVFYWATFLDEDGTVVYYGKHNFYDTVGQPVLIFNRQRELVRLNGEAEKYLAGMAVPAEKFLAYDQLMDGRWFSPVRTVPNPYGDPSFFLQSSSNGQMIYCHRCDVVDNKKRPIGFSLTLYNLQTIDRIVQDLEKRAYTDVLCRCFNRTCFEQRKLEILETAVRPLALVVADVDDLKTANDQYGHKAGDEYISACAAILKKVARSGDFLFRIGGDEFVLFLPGTGEAGVSRVKRAVCDEIVSLKLDHPCGLSLGYSVIGEGDADLEKHFAIADAEMYRQKQSRKVGRNP